MSAVVRGDTDAIERLLKQLEGRQTANSASSISATGAGECAVAGLGDGGTAIERMLKSWKVATACSAGCMLRRNWR
jgi:fructose-1-phosphate kinase PfkB-like protein